MNNPNIICVNKKYCEQFIINSSLLKSSIQMDELFEGNEFKKEIFQELKNNISLNKLIKLLASIFFQENNSFLQIQNEIYQNMNDFLLKIKPSPERKKYFLTIYQQLAIKKTSLIWIQEIKKSFNNNNNNDFSFLFSEISFFSFEILSLMEFLVSSFSFSILKMINSYFKSNQRSLWYIIPKFPEFSQKLKEFNQNNYQKYILFLYFYCQQNTNFKETFLDDFIIFWNSLIQNPSLLNFKNFISTQKNEISFIASETQTSIIETSSTLIPSSVTPTSTFFPSIVTPNQTFSPLTIIPIQTSFQMSSPSIQTPSLSTITSIQGFSPLIQTSILPTQIENTPQSLTIEIGGLTSSKQTSSPSSITSIQTSSPLIQTSILSTQIENTPQSSTIQIESLTSSKQYYSYQKSQSKKSTESNIIIFEKKEKYLLLERILSKNLNLNELIKIPSYLINNKINKFEKNNSPKNILEQIEKNRQLVVVSCNQKFDFQNQLLQGFEYLNNEMKNFGNFLNFNFPQFDELLKNFKTKNTDSFFSSSKFDQLFSFLNDSNILKDIISFDLNEKIFSFSRLSEDKRVEFIGEIGLENFEPFLDFHYLFIQFFELLNSYLYLFLDKIHPIQFLPNEQLKQKLNQNFNKSEIEYSSEIPISKVMPDLANSLFENLSSLNIDILKGNYNLLNYVPEDIKEKVPITTIGFIGTQGAITRFHFDLGQNVGINWLLNTENKGFKRWYFVPYEKKEILTKIFNGESTLFLSSLEVNFEILLKHAEILELTILVQFPGDMVFVPSGYIHLVEVCGETLFSVTSEILLPPTALLAVKEFPFQFKSKTYFYPLQIAIFNQLLVLQKEESFWNLLLIYFLLPAFEEILLQEQNLINKIKTHILIQHFQKKVIQCFDCDLFLCNYRVENNELGETLCLNCFKEVNEKEYKHWILQYQYKEDFLKELILKLQKKIKPFEEDGTIIHFNYSFWKLIENKNFNYTEFLKSCQKKKNSTITVFQNLSSEEIKEIMKRYENKKQKK